MTIHEQSPEISDLQNKARSRSPLLKKTVSEGGNLVNEPKRLEDKIHSASENMRRRVSLNEGRSVPSDLKRNEMEIVQEQEEGSQGSSNSSRQYDADRSKKSRKDRRGQTPESVLPVIGAKNDDLKNEVDTLRKSRKS